MKLDETSNNSNVYPLTFGQKGLWLLHQMDPNSDRYNMPITFKVSRLVSASDLKLIFKQLFDKHPILTSIFGEQNGEPFRRPLSNVNIEIQEINLDGLSGSDQSASPSLIKLIEQESSKSFDLANDLPIRLTLIKGISSHILLVTFHHLVFDGASIPVLMQDLESSAARLQKTDVTDSFTPIEFDHFCQWQNQWLQSEEGGKAKDFWRSKLASNLPRLPFNKVARNNNQQSIVGQIKSFKLPRPIIERISSIAQKNKCSEYLVWMSAYATFLSRYYNQPELIIGSPSMGRPSSEFDDYIGFFVNLVPIHYSVPKHESFNQIVKNHIESVYDCLSNADYPLAKMVSDSCALELRGDEPLFQTSFVWTSIQHLDNFTSPTLALELLPLAHQTGEQAMSFEFIVAKDDVEVLVKYREQLFGASEIERMADDFLCFVENLTLEPSVSVGEISLLSADNEDFLLHKLNQTEAGYSKSLSLKQLFENQVENHPVLPAVSDPKTHLSYQALNANANQFASYLRASGLSEGDRVGLCLSPSTAFVSSMLAILKAGGVYVPLDPNYPADRLNYIVDDASLKFILTENNSQLKVNNDCLIINIDDESTLSEIKAQCDKNLDDSVGQAEQPAYLIYTSGSTGVPKGVKVAHYSVVNLLSYLASLWDIKSPFNSALWTSINFDVSIFELFMPLVYSGHLHIPDSMSRLSPGAYFNWLEEKRIQLGYLPPFFVAPYEKWLSASSEKTGSHHGLEYLLVGVEPINEGRLRQIEKQLPAVKIINAYGPTEATVCCTVYPLWLNEISTAATITPIGQPVANTVLYIFDENFELTPVGLPGELFIGGDCLAQGYWQDPKLTDDKFIENPYGDERAEKLYRSGDIVRYNENGMLEFIGRKDSQIKLNGYRIELGEIEQCISKVKGVTQAAVAISKIENQSSLLVGYFTSDISGDDSHREEMVTKELSAKLPSYMVPRIMIHVNKMPLTSNGKIDRVALPNPANRLNALINEPLDTQVEKQLAQIMVNLLKVNLDRIAKNTSFFHLGGDSLLAVKLLNEVAAKFDAQLSLNDVFDNARICQLATKIEETRLNKKLLTSLNQASQSEVEEIEW
jgi:polyketide synthase PksN